MEVPQADALDAQQSEVAGKMLELMLDHRNQKNDLLTGVVTDMAELLKQRVEPAIIVESLKARLAVFAIEGLALYAKQSREKDEMEIRARRIGIDV
jgi:ferredoxin-fold anticodon binding domain-containing protein